GRRPEQCPSARWPQLRARRHASPPLAPARTRPRAIRAGRTPPAAQTPEGPTLPSGACDPAWRAGARAARRPATDRSRGPAAPVARGDPDPPAERPLHDEVAQVQAQAQAALRPAAAGRPGLVEDGFEVAGGQALAVVGDRHLEPRALELTGFDLDRARGVLEGVADQVAQHLAQVGGLAESGRQVLRQLDLDGGGPLRIS